MVSSNVETIRCVKFSARLADPRFTMLKDSFSFGVIIWITVTLLMILVISLAKHVEEGSARQSIVLPAFRFIEVGT